METNLEVKNLNIEYITRSGTVHAVKDASFSVAKKETLGIVGESGCGKSTTGHAILKLLPSNARATGEIIYNGKNILKISNKEMRQIRGKDISIVFQDPMTSLDPIMRVKDHFLELARAHDPKVKEEEVIKVASEALEAAGVSAKRLDNYPFEFSGGMRQRVMIALGIALKPNIIVADEPTTSLDVVVQEQIMEVFRNLKKTKDMSIILITHDLGVVAELADKVVVMYAGEVMEYADVYNLYKNPLHPYTQLLLKSVPNIKIDDMELHHIPGSLPDLKNLPPGCRFYDRCPFAKDKCKKEEPPVFKVDKREVRCWLYE
jgi:peptide/nickel transport system ATP-binding protein